MEGKEQVSRIFANKKQVQFVNFQTKQTNIIEIFEYRAGNVFFSFYTQNPELARKKS